MPRKSLKQKWSRPGSNGGPLVCESSAKRNVKGTHTRSTVTCRTIGAKRKGVPYTRVAEANNHTTGHPSKKKYVIVTDFPRPFQSVVDWDSQKRRAIREARDSARYLYTSRGEQRPSRVSVVMVDPRASLALVYQCHWSDKLGRIVVEEL